MAIETKTKSENGKLLSITGLAAYLGLSRTVVYELLYTEQIPAAKILLNKRRYWLRENIDEFLQGGTKGGGNVGRN
jgi:predicted DNA-binding transcriptional regulator AlpA